MVIDKVLNTNPSDTLKTQRVLYKGMKQKIADKCNRIYIIGNVCNLIDNNYVMVVTRCLFIS